MLLTAQRKKSLIPEEAASKDGEMKKALCFQCKEWSSNTKVCEHCGYIISQEVKDEIKRKEDLKLNPPKPPSKLEKAFRYLKNSNNVFLKIIYYILMAIWTIYAGIVMIIMYLVASVVG